MAFVKLHGLQAGHFTMPEASFIHPSEPDATRNVPSLSFLIEHTSSSDGRLTRLLFDLGLRRFFEEYPDQIQQHMQKRRPYDLSRNVVTSLQSLGLAPDDIDYVVLSHVHWDHVGRPADFANSTFIVGPGSGEVLAGKTHQVGSHACFEKDLLPEERIIELANPGKDTSNDRSDQEHARAGLSTEPPWRPMASLELAERLEHTLDLFGDGMVSVVNAPGHLQGHINLLVKVGDFNSTHLVYLAGDACHDRRLLYGEKQIAQWKVDGAPHCIHIDKETAEKTVEKIAAIERLGVEIIFAHDKEWEERELKKGNARRLVG